MIEPSCKDQNRRPFRTNPWPSATTFPTNKLKHNHLTRSCLTSNIKLLFFMKCNDIAVKAKGFDAFHRPKGGATKHRMRKRSRKMWWVVHCRSKKNLRPESRMDIEEILKMKLETIKEEPEIKEDNGALRKPRIIMSKKVKKIQLKMKMGWIFTSQLSLKESYVLFMTGLSSKGGLSGLPWY